MSEVLFIPSSASGPEGALTARLVQAITAAGFTESLAPAARVAIKVHPGEKDNSSYLRPTFAAAAARALTTSGLRPFVTETTTLYSRQRFTPAELETTSAMNGYTEESLGCPFVVADDGPDLEVEAPGSLLGTVGVASRIADADALLVLSHFTCHCWMAGIGGSLKQLGMGCVGRRTKAAVHRATVLTIDDEKCTACGSCADVCKSDGLTIGDTARINDECVRCGVCIGACPEEAIGYEHDLDTFASALGEAAAGTASVFGSGRSLYCNFVLDVTWHCDCEDFSDDPVFPNVGILLSRDPVAVDQASADLVNRHEPCAGSSADSPEIRGAPDRILALSRIEWWKHLESAERHGAGTREYTLVRFD